MTLEEAILDKVRYLHHTRQEEMLGFADALGCQDAGTAVPTRNRTAEIKWMTRNRTAFAGQWVAVEGDRLVAADADAQKVFAAARAEGIDSPFVVHIFPEDSLPFVSGC
jgi:hypothetical protein